MSTLLFATDFIFLEKKHVCLRVSQRGICAGTAAFPAVDESIGSGSGWPVIARYLRSRSYTSGMPNIRTFADSWFKSISFRMVCRFASIGSSFLKYFSCSVSFFVRYWTFANAGSGSSNMKGAYLLISCGLKVHTLSPIPSLSPVCHATHQSILAPLMQCKTGPSYTLYARIPVVHLIDGDSRAATIARQANPALLI